MNVQLNCVNSNGGDRVTQSPEQFSSPDLRILRSKWEQLYYFHLEVRSKKINSGTSLKIDASYSSTCKIGTFSSVYEIIYEAADRITESVRALIYIYSRPLTLKWDLSVIAYHPSNNTRIERSGTNTVGSRRKSLP